MQVRDLLLQATVDVFDRQPAGGRVAWLDDVEEVRVGQAGPQPEVGGAFPGGEPGLAEVEGGVTVNVCKCGEVALVLRDAVEVLVVLCGGEEGEKVLFELQPDEFFGAQVAVMTGSRGI